MDTINGNADFTSNIITITEDISYLPSGTNPLSSDVIFINTHDYMFIFDTGSSDAAKSAINSVPKKKLVILSHFHKDHTANVPYISFDKLFCSKETFKHINTGIVVNEPLKMEASIDITILPLPSTHAKGSLILCYKNEYAFLGDALYTAAVNGIPAYNCQLLKQMTDMLSALNVKYFALSHDKKFIYTKEEVLSDLKKIYNRRDKNDNYIMP